MLSIYDIANYFSKKEKITDIKCQILYYYTQAWSLVFDDTAIIDANFIADIYGPSNKELNEFFKKENITQFDLIPINLFSNIAKPIENSDNIYLLEEIWSVYGRYDRLELETLVKRDISYFHARRGYAELEPGKNIISKAVMKIFYKALSDIYDIENIESK